MAMRVNENQQDIIAARLKLARQSKGLTQLEMANLTEIPRSTIANIEAGSGLRQINKFSEYCKKLGVTPNDILLLE